MTSPPRTRLILGLEGRHPWVDDLKRSRESFALVDLEVLLNFACNRETWHASTLCASASCCSYAATLSSSTPTASAAAAIISHLESESKSSCRASRGGAGRRSWASARRAHDGAGKWVANRGSAVAGSAWR